jgi:hypothetical protein
MSTKISSLIGLFTFLAAGTLSVAAPASAATIVGTIDISGSNILATGLGIQVPGSDEPGAPLVPATTVDFGFIGDRNPGTPDLVPGVGEFLINSADGVFNTFNPLPLQAGRVKDLPAGGVFEPVDDFLAFATPVGGSTPVTNPTTFTGFFDLENISGITYTSTANGINVNFDVEGEFTLDGVKYDGEGIIGGEALFSNNVGRFSDFNSFIDYISIAGNRLNVDSWSGNLNAVPPVVPEPASVLGLMALGLAGVTLRKRSQKS